MQEVKEETGYLSGFLTYAMERGRCVISYLPGHTLMSIMSISRYRTTFYYSRPEAVKFKSQWKRCERAGEKKRLVEERIAGVKEREQVRRAALLVNLNQSNRNRR